MMCVWDMCDIQRFYIIECSPKIASGNPWGKTSSPAIFVFMSDYLNFPVHTNLCLISGMYSVSKVACPPDQSLAHFGEDWQHF